MKKWLILIFSSTLLFTGCREDEVTPNKPTSPRVEKSAPPYDDAAWVDIEYRWSGGTYVEVPAHWERSKRIWVGGNWEPVKGGHRWKRGHWK